MRRLTFLMATKRARGADGTNTSPAARVILSFTLGGAISVLSLVRIDDRFFKQVI